MTRNQKSMNIDFNIQQLKTEENKRGRKKKNNERNEKRKTCLL